MAINHRTRHHDPKLAQEEIILLHRNKSQLWKQPIVEFLAERYTHKNAFKGQIIAQFFTNICNFENQNKKYSVL